MSSQASAKSAWSEATLFADNFTSHIHVLLVRSRVQLVLRLCGCYGWCVATVNVCSIRLVMFWRMTRHGFAMSISFYRENVITLFTTGNNCMRCSFAILCLLLEKNITISNDWYQECERLTSEIKIVVVSYPNYLYQQLELLISGFRKIDVWNSSNWYQKFELLIS